MKIHVKFDFATICRNLLEAKLRPMNIEYRLDSSGDITILQKLTSAQKQVLSETLNCSGVEIITDQQLILVQQIKDILMEILRMDEYSEKFKISKFIEEKLPYTYTYLSRIFSETTHISLEKFMILKRIDYAKELMLEDHLNLTEIAHRLNYSSASHFSKQFKLTTGFSPSEFIKLKEQLKTSIKN